MTFEEKFEVDTLVYDNLREECHELGKARYYEGERATDGLIEKTCEERFQEFHEKYPEYSETDFRDVFFFIIAEGKDIAMEEDRLLD